MRAVSQVWLPDAGNRQPVTLEFRVGDVFDRLAEIADGTIDLIVTSPPFLALRSYLPADHPDKHREIGSEATPADFLDTLLALTAEFGRVLAPHGSICVELGDTYSGAAGYGQPEPDGPYGERSAAHWEGRTAKRFKRKDDGWPLAKSLTGIPTLYPWSLAYGRNLLTGQPIVGPPWRIRNLIVWARPNPPVGALGDKFRPATSYITVACRGPRRYFDLDAVRGEAIVPQVVRVGVASASRGINGGDSGNPDKERMSANPAGAPPLDWHTDLHPEDGDWLWKLSTQPYAGSHYATFPMALPKRLIEAMCPLRVCVVCGRPSERIVDAERHMAQGYEATPSAAARMNGKTLVSDRSELVSARTTTYTTLGWSDCGHDNWRTGIVLDPFAGSGTTLEAAQAVGRHAIGIDLDPRNADLARDRCGMFLTVA